LSELQIAQAAAEDIGKDEIVRMLVDQKLRFDGVHVPTNEQEDEVEINTGLWPEKRIDPWFWHVTSLM
jgi:hypothetical protein